MNDLNWKTIGVSVLLALVLTLAVVAAMGGFSQPHQPAEPDISVAGGTSNFDTLAADDVEVADDLTVGDDATITGDLAVTGGLTGKFVEYASTGSEVECGTSSTFTETTSITATALTTATYVLVTQITDPASTAAYMTVDAPSGNVMTLNSWEADATVGTTGITAYWCAVGPE